MSDYRPYLWGSFAVSHYQVKSHLISKTLNSFPSTTEVLSYVPLKRLKQTISFYPVDRNLCIKVSNINTELKLYILKKLIFLESKNITFQHKQR